jgi:hypothetical protein
MVARCVPRLFQSKERREATAAVFHRRRMALSAAIHATLFNQTYNFRLGSSIRSRRRFRLPFLFEELASSMTDRFFRRMYRMPRAVFYKLLNRLEGIDEWNTRPTLAAKLSMCLRWLSGGSYIDITVCHRVAVSSFFSNRDEIIFLINRSLHILFNPADVENHKRQL